MEWKNYAAQIKELLGFKGNPVAITYSMKPPSSPAKGKFRVCDAFLQASNGKVIDFTVSTSACSGGTWQLGLSECPKGEKDKALKEFLVNGMKLYCSIATFHRAQALTTSPPLGLAEHVILSPLAQSEFRPDIILFICNPEQACRLFTLDGYDTGIPPRIEMSGATCHQAVAYPVVTGEMNISLMDYTSRHIRGYKPEDLLVSVPYHRFLGIMRSIEHCTAGIAKMEIPKSFHRIIRTDIK
ncbi:MAG: DUF169 domain-containing protein [Bacteroidia bacterium]|nr:DUF169 domain-containing protein [Bacteroidia bacterium]